MLKRFGWRLLRAIHSLLVAVDQLAFVILATPYYLIWGGEEPSAWETISSRVGREANNGWLWARVAQVVIDWLFRLLRSPPGHCQRARVAPDLLSEALGPPPAG